MLGLSYVFTWFKFLLLNLSQARWYLHMITGLLIILPTKSVINQSLKTDYQNKIQTSLFISCMTSCVQSNINWKIEINQLTCPEFDFVLRFTKNTPYFVIVYLLESVFLEALTWFYSMPQRGREEWKGGREKGREGGRNERDEKEEGKKEGREEHQISDGCIFCSESSGLKAY